MISSLRSTALYPARSRRSLAACSLTLSELECSASSVRILKAFGAWLTKLNLNSLSISPDINNPSLRSTTFDEVKLAYYDQILGLIHGGCDLLLVETIFDTLNAKAAFLAAQEAFDKTGTKLPLMVSVTITDRSGRTLSGQTLDAFYESVRHVKPFSIGLNCALGANEMRPWLSELARISESYVTCYPNAGLPNAFGEYDDIRCIIR